MDHDIRVRVAIDFLLEIIIKSLYDLATNVALSWELAAIERGYHWNLLIWTLSLVFSGTSDELRDSRHLF